jgi:hypothetical protein
MNVTGAVGPIRFWNKDNIAFADYFAAALVSKLNAKVVTGDKEFKSLEKEIGIEWIT